MRSIGDDGEGDGEGGEITRTHAHTLVPSCCLDRHLSAHSVHVVPLTVGCLPAIHVHTQTATRVSLCISSLSQPVFTIPGEKRREFYIPPAPPEEEDKIFATMAAGINFDKYDEIAAEVTGSDAPAAIAR